MCVCGGSERRGELSDAFFWEKSYNSKAFPSSASPGSLLKRRRDVRLDKCDHKLFFLTGWVGVHFYISPFLLLQLWLMALVLPPPLPPLVLLGRRRLGWPGSLAKLW